MDYRTSCIPAMGYTVLDACFRLKKGNRDEIEAYMNELSLKRREKQPLQYPSAGSTFKRPKGHFAARLIEDAGLKGILFYQKSLNSASTSASIVVATSKAAVTTAAED